MLVKSADRKTFLRSTGLATIMVATLAASAGSASAQTVIFGPETSPVTLGSDGEVIVTSTGSIIVDPGTVALDAVGNNSIFTLFGPVSATIDTPGGTLNTVNQDGDTYNILNVGQGGNITAIDAGDALQIAGVVQISAIGENTINLENATIRSSSPDAEAYGIFQFNDTGENNIQFGPNGRVFTNGNGLAFGIVQVGTATDGFSEFGANTLIQADALAGDALGFVQVGIDSGDLTSIFGTGARVTATATGDAIAISQESSVGFVSTSLGAGARITANGAGDGIGIQQETSSGPARTILGANTQINTSGGSFSSAVYQESTDNYFVLGENSIINVRAGVIGFGLIQDGNAVPTTSRAIIGANSRINVVSADEAIGIFSEGEGTTSSFLIVEQGAEIAVRGNSRATGVQIDADNFYMQNRGRITATSTGTPQVSYGVRTFGEGNNFENHGSVFADLAPDSYAILMTGNNNMLSLLTYPVIQGQISFSNGSGSGFGTGNTLLVGRGFDAAFTVGASPTGLTVLGQGQSLTVSEIGTNLFKVVSIDTDGFFRSSSVRMADDLIRFLQQEITTRGFKNRQFLNQENGLIQDFWFDASGFGQHSTTGRAYSHALGAFTVGYDRAFEDNGLGGIYAGYSIGSVNQGNPYWDNTLQTAYAGIYYDRAFDRILTGINLLGGINWDDVSRTYLDNTVLGGIVNAGDNGVGFLISPEVTVGYELPYRSHLFIPSIGVRYSLFHQDSYSEGGANGLNLSARDHQQINVRLQVAGLGFSALNQDATRWSTTLRGGLDIYANWGDDLDATVMGFAVPYDENLNDAGVRPFLGADVEYLVTDRASLDFGVEAAYDSIDAVFGSINAGFSVLF